MSLNDLVLDQGEMAVSLLETKNGEIMVTGYEVKESGFSGEELRDVYRHFLQRASVEKERGKCCLPI